MKIVWTKFQVARLGSHAGRQLRVFFFCGGEVFAELGEKSMQWAYYGIFFGSQVSF